MRKKFSPVGLVVAGLITTALIVAGLAAYYNTSTAYDCKVIDKDRVWVSYGGGGSSKMRVYTENCGTFEVVDNIFKTGFNSADRFAKIKVGNTYDIEHYGWRFGLFSMFPKIESIK